VFVYSFEETDDGFFLLEHTIKRAFELRR
jgi:hypothetical protein